MSDRINWDLVAVAARALGVNDKALEKWRQRKSVPHKWRLPLIKYTRGAISPDVFDDPRPKRESQ